MAQLRIERVASLPAQLTASTLYFVRATDADLAEIVLVGTDVAEVRHLLNKTDVAAMIAAASTELSNIIVVPNIAARDALAPTQNEIVLVVDATGDPSVNQGAATYLYDLATTSWIKIAEYESMDVSFDWSNILNGPSSTPAQIDSAVSQAHTHANKAVLDLLGADEAGLTYDGQPVGNFITNAEW